jgi:hypothetical protein
MGLKTPNSKMGLMELSWSQLIAYSKNYIVAHRMLTDDNGQKPQK